MVDLPQHAAQISLFLNLGNPDFPFSNEFQLKIFTPYLLGYALIAAVTPLLGIVSASKLIIWLALAAFPLASRFLLRQAGADPYWAWLTFPLLYGFAYQWGLLNFLIAAPIGIFFLALVWRQENPPEMRSAFLVVLMLYVLFFSHALIMALFSLIALVYWLLSSTRLRDFVRRAWPLAALIPIILVWLIVTSKHPQTQRPPGWDLSWTRSTDSYYIYIANWVDPNEPGFGRLTGFIPRLLGVRPSAAFTLTGLFLFALPVLTGGSFANPRLRIIPVLSITLALLFLPSYLFGNAYTFQRFTLFSLPLFLIMIDAPKRPTRIQQYIRLLAPLIAFTWISFASFNAMKFDNESDGFETILSKMEANKRAISLVFARDDERSIAPTFLHFPAWYSALNSGITNPSFAQFYGMPLIYKTSYTASVDSGFEWGPHQFDWQTHEGYRYDYFVARSPVDHGAFLFRTSPCRISLMEHSGQWWLYRRDPKC